MSSVSSDSTSGYYEDEYIRLQDVYEELFHIMKKDYIQLQDEYEEHRDTMRNNFILLQDEHEKLKDEHEQLSKDYNEILDNFGKVLDFNNMEIKKLQARITDLKKMSEQ